MAQMENSAAFREAGSAYGRELAAAMDLAARDADHATQREMGRLVLERIGGAVRSLREVRLSEALVSEYEIACRTAFRDELLAAIRRRRGATEPNRAAA